MAVVILKSEPRYVSGRLLKPGARCTVPDSLARAMETRGLCSIVRPGQQAEAQVAEIKTEPPAEQPAPKKPIKRAAKKKEED